MMSAATERTEYLVGCWKPMHQAAVAIDLDEMDDVDVTTTVGRLSLLVDAPESDEKELQMRALENVVSVEKDTEDVNPLTIPTSEGARP